jgi:hypothetical protein
VGHPSYFVLLSIVLILNVEQRFVSRLCFRLLVKLKEAVNLVVPLERAPLNRGCLFTFNPKMEESRLPKRRILLRIKTTNKVQNKRIDLIMWGPSSEPHWGTSYWRDRKFYLADLLTKEIRPCKKNQHDAQIFLSIFRQPLHVSGVPRPIIRRYNGMYTTIGTYYSF